MCALHFFVFVFAFQIGLEWAGFFVGTFKIVLSTYIYGAKGPQE